jgi:hypothetical protein
VTGAATVPPRLRGGRSQYSGGRSLNTAIYIKAVRPIAVGASGEQAIFVNGDGKRYPYYTFLRQLHVYANRAGVIRGSGRTSRGLLDGWNGNE